MASVVCGGLIALDLVLNVAAHPAVGAKHRASASRLIAGGGGFNAAIAVARLGGHAALAGTLGDDAFGGLLRDKMGAFGIDDTLVSTIPGSRTAHSAITITPDGERTIVNYRDDTPDDTNPSFPASFPLAAALCDTRFPGLATALMAAARAAGVPGVMDAEAPVAPAADALRQASHVAFSAQGLQDFAGGTDRSALERAVGRLGRWACVTRGPAPVLCHDGCSITEIAVPHVTAVDTLGAGDTWHGAFVLALARGDTALDAVRFASDVAARMVARQPPWDNENGR